MMTNGGDGSKAWSNTVLEDKTPHERPHSTAAAAIGFYLNNPEFKFA
jgi:hypothetical protein